LISILRTCGGIALIQSPRGGNLMTHMVNVVRVLKKERDRLTNQLQGISAALSAFGSTYASSNGASRTISAAGKARIAAAQKARWAKLKGTKGQVNSAAVVPKKGRTMSTAARKKIAAAQRARWAKVKTAK
jgi:hypothetical protein